VRPRRLPAGLDQIDAPPVYRPDQLAPSANSAIRTGGDAFKHTIARAAREKCVRCYPRGKRRQAHPLSPRISPATGLAASCQGRSNLRSRERTPGTHPLVRFGLGDAHRFASGWWSGCSCRRETSLCDAVGWRRPRDDVRRPLGCTTRSRRPAKARQRTRRACGRRSQVKLVSPPAGRPRLVRSTSLRSRVIPPTRDPRWAKSHPRVPVRSRDAG